MEKNGMLKGAGIALIVLGVLYAIGALLCFVAGELIASIIGQEGSTEDAALVSMIVTIAGVLLLIDAGAYIGAGVVGVQQKSPKACFVIAIVLIVICGISAVTSLIGGQWLSAILVIIAPIFYLIGAIQLRKAVAEAQANPNTDDLV